MLQVRVRCLLVLPRSIYPSARHYSTSFHDAEKDLRTSPNEQPRVLITGSGLSGLATALALHNRGINSQVVGSHDQETSSVYLGINGMQILHSLSPSLYDSVRKAGQPITNLEICNHKGKAFGTVNYKDLGQKLVPGIPDITPVGISTSTITQLLKKECQSRKIKIDPKSQLITCVGDSDAALLCRFRGRLNELYEVVVAADGANSKIRDEYFKAQEYGLRKKFCGFIWMSAIVDRPFMFNGNTLSELWGEEKRFIGIPLENDKVQLYGAFRSEYQLEAQVEGPKPNIDFVKRFPLFGGFAPHVSYALENSQQQCHLYVPQEIKLNKYSHGRMVLVGNAAHTISPNVHMADTLALEDAVVLAHTLSSKSGKYPTIENRLDAYSELRVPRVKNVSQISSLINSIGHRRKLGQTLFTPFTLRSGKLVKRETDLVQSGFAIPAAEE